MRATKKSGNQAITTVAARQNFSELINRVAYGKDRVLLTRRSRPLVAVVPIEDIALLEAMEDRDDLNAARAALREVKRKGTIPWTRVKKELGL
ncbi:MAG TPA: type II toxin-antitoxin system Phd/YefM family antitoxin [Candidatus Sulfotelmatobacter sp.]|jgi:prevent-host-death family protein|nr:type II toxin-antitoxin system Phd/YefM family antitoxin [Candidatus Sulfotelmatobacter sp.]